MKKHRALLIYLGICLLIVFIAVPEYALGTITGIAAIIAIYLFFDWVGRKLHIKYLGWIIIIVLATLGKIMNTF